MLTKNSREVNFFHSISCQLQAELRAQNYNSSQLFTLLGILNNYIFVAALNAGVITRGCKRRQVYHCEHLGKMFLSPAVSVTATSLNDNLRKYWEGKALRSKHSVEKYRRVLSEVFKIFTLEDRDWAEPLDRHRRPNPCGDFNMVRGQELAHQIELLLLNDFGFELEMLELDCSDMQAIFEGNYNYVRVEEKSFPKHKGATLKRLYDMAFGALSFFWGRTGEGTPDAYGARDCAYKQDVGEPIPEVSEAIEKEHRSIQAENKFAEICAFEPERELEEILETETVEIIETEILESNGIFAIVDKIAEKIPLLNLVRRSMKVPPFKLPRPPQEDSANIPYWVLAESEKALAWWENRISKSSLWLQDFAPSWVWKRLVPF